MNVNDVLANFRRRPHRVWEAIIVLLAIGGIVLLPETEAAVNSVIALLVATGVLGSEVAQTKTTPLVEPRDNDGTPLVRRDLS